MPSSLASMSLVKTRPNGYRKQPSSTQNGAPLGVTGHLAKIDAAKIERKNQKELGRQRELADKIHRMKAELCQNRMIRRSVVDACVRAILEPQVEIRITFDDQKEAGFAVEKIPSVLLKLGLADKNKTLTHVQGSTNWPILELRNGSAILFKLELKGPLQTT
jgi:hypothetical protein